MLFLCAPYITWRNYAAWSVSALNKTVTDHMIVYICHVWVYFKEDISDTYRPVVC